MKPLDDPGNQINFVAELSSNLFENAGMKGNLFLHNFEQICSHYEVTSIDDIPDVIAKNISLRKMYLDSRWVQERSNINSLTPREREEVGRLGIKYITDHFPELITETTEGSLK